VCKINGAYVLSGNPDHVVHGDNVTITLTCVADDNNKLVTWTKGGINIASIKNECKLANQWSRSHLYVIYNNFTFI
jgi:hypothetical protein